MNSFTFSLVLPAYNEEMRLPATLRTLAGFLVEKDAEVIVVVERSTDATLRVARDFAVENGKFRVLENEGPRGKGAAVRKGMLEARGGIIFFMDADLSVPVEAVDAFLAEFERDPELGVLVGNRQHAASEIVAAQGWLRRNMGQMFNRMVRRILGIELRDTQCGFKAFRHGVARVLFAAQTIDGFAFDVEILLLAQKRGVKIADLPVEWRNSTDSKVRLAKDSLRMLWDIGRMRWM